MKVYIRKDGFEVDDSSGLKTIEQICFEFGGNLEDWQDVTAQRDASSLKNLEEEAQRASKNKIQELIEDLAQQIVNAMADGDDALVASLRAERDALKAQIIKE